MFSNEEVKIANATSRTNGAVGKNAIVPRKVSEWLGWYGDKEATTILDFGAGKNAIHAQELLNDGWQVLAYEFGENVNHAVHRQVALMNKYDLVYASNVLNVQSTVKMLRETLKQIASVTSDDGGVFIANYPQSPRKLDMTPGMMITELKKHFSAVIRMAGTTASTPVWLCHK